MYLIQFMSKFIKRLQKSIKKNIHTCVVVGNNPTCLENIVEGFDTMFCVNWMEILPKNKKIDKF